MKNSLLIILLITALSNIGLSQNTLFLKNGDTMSGKLEGFRDDTLLFNFQGNILKFKSNDILSVYFNGKDTSKDPGKAIVATETNFSKTVKISGLVTYLNKFEFEPDAGSDVYFAENTSIKDFNLATLDSFNIYIVYKGYKKAWKVPTNKLIENIYNEGEKYNFDKEGFNLMDKRAAQNIYKIVNARNVIKASVDGNGNYSLNVSPGTYYVLFKSRNSTRLNKLETAEPFKCYEINIREGEDITMDYAFGFEFK
jgi:hypothetical protein